MVLFICLFFLWSATGAQHAGFKIGPQRVYLLPSEDSETLMPSSPPCLFSPAVLSNWVGGTSTPPQPLIPSSFWTSLQQVWIVLSWRSLFSPYSIPEGYNAYHNLSLRCWVSKFWCPHADTSWCSTSGAWTEKGLPTKGEGRRRSRHHAKTLYPGHSLPSVKRRN